MVKSGSMVTGCPDRPEHRMQISHRDATLRPNLSPKLHARQPKLVYSELFRASLGALTEVLGQATAKRLIVMGDFNQAIGSGSRARHDLRLALQNAFPASMTIATSDLAFQGRKSIDHIALSNDWVVSSLDVISNIHEERKLSDHFGVVADLSAQHSR